MGTRFTAYTLNFPSRPSNFSKIPSRPSNFSKFTSRPSPLAPYMGKPRLDIFTRIATAARSRLTPPSPNPNPNPNPNSRSALSVSGGAMEAPVPLREAVADCVRRWFQDTLKEARAGDTAMQVLVAQMYQTGYGVQRNEQKARIWIEKASKYRSSVWKVRNKRPGYNASDSDSDEVEENAKQ